MRRSLQTCSTFEHPPYLSEHVLQFYHAFLLSVYVYILDDDDEDYEMCVECL